MKQETKHNKYAYRSKLMTLMNTNKQNIPYLVGLIMSIMMHSE